jgi:hypothetical protein
MEKAIIRYLHDIKSREVRLVPAVRKAQQREASAAAIEVKNK